MRKCIVLAALLIAGVPTIASAQHETPGTVTQNIETIKAGSLIIAMDNDKQNIGSLFNIASYGLVIDLLNNNIPVKWAIRAGKAKDAKDFTATASRIAPSALSASTLDFAGGPFIVEESYATLALARITAFGRNVAVYQMTQDAQIDIRYDILFKPRPFVNTTNSAIITGLFDNAGITTYKVGADFSVEESSCYTIIMEPHNSVTTGTPTIRSFLQSGGNFYAQCLSTVSFENAPSGFFMSSAGIMGADTAGTLNYPNPDLSFSQFIGAVNPAPGGSVEDWKLNAGSTWNSGTSSHTQSPASPSSPQLDNGTVHYAGMMSKFLSPSDTGGVVFYVGGHNYAGTALLDLNGQRLMFNAVLTPARRPGTCSIQPLEIKVPDLTLTKTHTGSYLIGPQDTYTFTVSNIGNAVTVDNYTVTDTLPAGLTFISGAGTNWTFSSSVIGGGRTVVTASNATSLGIAQSSTFTINVGITAAAIGSQTNTAYVSGGGEVKLTNNTASVGSQVVGLTGRVFEDLNTIGVEDPTDPGFSGLTVTVVDNSVTYTATTDANGNWTVAGLTPSTTATVTIGTSGANSILAGAIQSVGSDPSTHSVGTSGTGDGGKDGFRNIQTNIAVTKTGPTTALVGDTIQYIITTTNSGPNPATFVVVTDTLPALATFVYASRGATLSSGVLTWPAVTVAVGGTVVDTVRVRTPSAVSTLLNIAAGTTQRFDTNAANNNGTASNARVSTQLTIPDVSITKTHTGYFTMGAPGVYTITVTNGGTGPARNVVVSDVLPTGLAYDSTKAVTGNWSFVRSGQTVTATVTDSIAAGGSASFSLYVTPTVVTSTSPTNTTVNNTATVTALRETAVGNNSVTDPTEVRYADLTITKTAGTFVQGQPSVWTITVTNSGTGPSTGLITVRDSVGVGQTGLTPAGSGWNFTTAAPIVTGTYAGSLAPGASASFTLTVTPGPTSYPTPTNTAVVSGGSDVKTDNNSVTATASLAGASDLKITKTASSTTPFVYGTNATYSITVTNIGAVATTGNIIVTDTLPAGLSFVSGTGSGWSFSSPSPGTVVVATYTGAALPALTGTTSFTVTALVLSTAPSVKNIGRVSGGGDGTPGNNADSVTTAVTAKPDLTIFKRAPASFTQGTNATYTIVAKNVGVAATTANTIVTDSLPAGVAYVSRAAVVGSWSFTVSGNHITATSSTVLQPNDSVVFSVTVTPLAAGVPSVTNKAVVSNTSENYLANDTASVTTPVVGLVDLNITKTSSTFAEGTQGTYTIAIKNIGTWPTSGLITVLDTLPANVTYVSAISNPVGWTIGAVGQVVTATSSTVMQVTDSVVFTVTVNVGNVGTSVTNRARVSGGNDSNTANNLATVTTTVGQKADLTMTKTSSTFTVGQTTATYTLTVTNIGSVATTGSIAVVDTLPAGVTFVSGAGSGWSVSAVGQVVTATAAALNLGSTKTSAITLTVSIAAGAFPSVTNTAWVSGGGETVTTNNSGSLTTAVLAADLTLAKTSLANFVIGSNTAAYSFVVTNAGDGAVPSGATITVVDTLPVGVTAVAKNGSSNWTVVFDPATRIMTATNTTGVAAGAAAQTLAINVTFGAGTAPSVTNTARVSVPNEINTANNTSSVTTPVNGIDLALTKTSSALFTPGTTGTYTLSVKNVGNVTTSGTMTVVDTLPANLTLTSVTTPQDNWTVSVTTVGGRAIVTATRTTTLAVNATTSITVNPTVTAAAMPSVYNRGWVSGGGQLSSPLNDSSSVVTPVATPDLTVTKLATTPTFDVAGTGIYRITVKNIGNYLAAGPITVRDTLPTGLTYSTASGTGWTFANVGQVVVATYAGNIAVADSAFFTLSVAVGQAASPNVTNTARVAAGTEQNVNNNSSTVTTLVGGQPDLLIIKTANTANFTYGASGTYTIKVKNVGTLPTSASITVVDSLAAGLAYTSGSGTGWTVNQASGVVTATNAGPIQAGDSAQFTITVTVGVGATSVGNTARVSGGGDSNTANNTSTITTPIIAPDLTVAKIATNTFQTGSPGTYEITVNNIGTAPTTANFTVVDTLRAGLTYSSGSGTNWSFAAVGQIVTATYSGPAVAAGGSTSFTLTVGVGAAAVPTVQNSAVVAGGGEWKTDNDTVGPITTNVGGQSDLTLAKSATGTFVRGSDATYTFVVSNIGTIATTGSIVVTDTLASELTFKSGTGTSWAFNAVGQVVTATYTGTDLPATTGTTSFTLTVGISVTAGSSVSNTAWVSGGGELNTTNDKSGPIVTPLGGAPNITVVKAVTPSTNIIPGSVLNYSITFLNGGNAPAVNVVVTDDLPTQVQYKIGSISESYPGSITAVTEFYNGTVWTYTPVSTGCSAPTGFDGCVKKIRWTLQSSMPQQTQGVIGLQARVK